MSKKKRKRNTSNGSSSKRKCFYLLQDEQVLESGTKRKVQDLEKSYRQLGMNVTVCDDHQYASWKRRCVLHRQNKAYEEALKIDMEKERLQKLQMDFSDRRKRCNIIANSYEKLFREKKYI